MLKIQTPIAPIVHPKMNSGKESVTNAEFGMRSDKSVPFAGAPRPPSSDFGATSPLLIHDLPHPGLLPKEKENRPPSF